MKEILIYTGIYDFTAETFINRLNEISKDEDIIIRLNSPGGSVFAGWGMIAALKERTGKNILKVDGNASSMAFFMLPFFDEVQALDITNFMIHRATGWVENEDDQKILDNINKSLKDKLEKRIDKDKFMDVTGISIKDIFEAEKRRDIWVTAKEAKKIGLIDRVVRLEPREINAMQKNLVAFSTFEDTEVQEPRGSEEIKEPIININKVKKVIMTKAELKAENPDLYNEIYNDGIKAEADRVGAFMAFSDIDLEAVKTEIKEGRTISQTFMAEMTIKSISNKTLDAKKEGSPETIKTPEGEEKTPTENDLEIAQAEKEIFAAAGITKEDK